MNTKKPTFHDMYYAFLDAVEEGDELYMEASAGEIMEMAINKQ